MSGYITKPILAVFGVLMAMVIIIAAVLLLSTTGIGGAGTSTGLVSTSTNYQTLLPFIGAIIAGGIALGALSKR
jgi:lipopolysaccharide export LptBFGC system permease protein LptF